MTHLLDTATWANGITMPEVLPERVVRIVGNSRQRKGLCSVSLLECALHHQRGRLDFSGSLSEFFEAGLSGDVDLIEITPQIAEATTKLPSDFPGDPFDRTIAATARVLDLILVTPDPLIRDSGFCKVEYYPFRPSRRA